MSTKFSAHPDLAVEQLQRAELEARQNSNKSHTNHRRHQAATGSRQTTSTKSLGTAFKSSTTTKNATKFASNASKSTPTAVKNADTGIEDHFRRLNHAFPSTRSSPARRVRSSSRTTTQPPPSVDVLDNKFAYNLPGTGTEAAEGSGGCGGLDLDALVLAYIDDIDLSYDEDDVYIQNPNSRTKNLTKDCVDCASSPSSVLRWSAASGATTTYCSAGVDVGEADYMQQRRFSRTTDDDYFTADPLAASAAASPIHAISDGCVSGVSSTLSSRSASTVSSPLSTPTRLPPAHFRRQENENLNHQNPNYPTSSNCCQKMSLSATANVDCGGASDSDKSCCNQRQCHHHHHPNSHSDRHLHHHHHHHNHQHALGSSTSLKSTSKAAATTAAAAAVASLPSSTTPPSASSSSTTSSGGGCKKSQKYDPRLLGPSRYRQLLPVVLCILSFAIVFSILIVYMDTTEIRHKQFRLNMSRDYEFFGVAQDDPTLIAFLREIHMRKYPMHFLKNAPLDQLDPTSSATFTSASSAAAAASTNFNYSTHYEGGLTPEMAHYVADLLGGKERGNVIQSLPGAMGHLMTAPWLASTLNWAGLIVEPEPRRFFTLRKQNAQRPGLQVVHACVSPNPYPKEVTIHNEESEVRINSLLDEETSWFNSRVKCFPLYSLMLACNRVEYDLLSLGVHGHELEILQTLPFERVQIEVISIHLSEDIARGYVDALTEFLAGKSYKLQKNFGRNYFYQRTKTTSRTRKKDILLLKTP